jgi:hypothetical protein
MVGHRVELTGFFMKALQGETTTTSFTFMS